MKYFDATAIILGAGKGTRAKCMANDNSINKVLWRDGENTIIEKTVSKFLEFHEVIVVCSTFDEEVFRKIFSKHNNVKIVLGGETRTESVVNALPFVKTEYVFIHDGARPFVSDALIEKLYIETKSKGNAIPYTFSREAVKIHENGNYKSFDRNNVLCVQTPQGFLCEQLKNAYASISTSFADDSEVLENYGVCLNMIEGENDNIKLTYPNDFRRQFGNNLRIGCGFDVHKLVENRPLILCGVTIPFEKGLLGHSDADVATHALMDAILSASNLPDIGTCFPDTEEKYKGISSILLLKEVMKMSCDFEIVNISISIAAQKPKLAPYINKMKSNLCDVLEIDNNRVNISATTTEELGIVGEGKGMSAYASVLLTK